MNKIKLGDFIERYGDGIHGTPNYDDKGTYYFVNGNNLINGRIQITDETLRVTEEEYEKIKRPLSDNTLLLSINGTLGRVAVYNGENIALGKSACYLNVKDDKNKYFVKCVLNTQEFQKYIQLVAHGSTIKNLAPSQVVEYEFNAPDEKVQEKIAFLLKLIDDKIDNNNEINTQLEAMAKTIYDYWFLQFNFPDKNGKPYKSSGGKMVWNEELKREIPEGWVTYTLAECVKCNEVSLGKNEDLNEINYLDTSNLTENKIESIVNIQKVKGYPSRAKRIVSQNDILISTVRPEQKHYGIIKHPVDNMVASTGFAVLSSRFGSEYNEIFYLFLTNKTNVDILNTIANSSVSSYPSINSDDILNLNISLPKDIKKLDNIARVFNMIFEKMAILQDENKELASLRDFLLPLLMNGQVGFKEC